jgi:hypothetical protein
MYISSGSSSLAYAFALGRTLLAVLLHNYPLHTMLCELVQRFLAPAAFA